MFYFPRYNESTDLLSGYSTYEEHYNHVKHIIITNQLKYIQTDVDNLEIDENNFPEHVWNQIAPNTESNQGESIAEGVKPLTEI